MKILLALAVSSLGLAVPLAADTLIVKPDGGSGAFSQISEAVAAARPGDVLLVEDGEYQPVVIDKPLTITGVTGRPLLVSNDSQSPLEVTGIPATGAVQLHNLEVDGFAPGFSKLGCNTAIRVSDCAGPVTLSDVTGRTEAEFALLPTESRLPPAVEISDCDQVLVLGCTVVGAVGGSGTGSLDGGGGMAISGSRVWVVDSEVNGGDSLGYSPLFFGVGPGQGGVSVSASSSVLDLAQTRIATGASGSAISLAGDLVVADGRAGLRLESSQARVAGGHDNSIVGGPSTPIDSKGGPAVQLFAGSVLHTASDAQLFPGGPSLILVELTSEDVWELENSPLPTMTFDRIGVKAGESVVLTVQGQPNSTALAFYDAELSSPMRLAGVAGDLLLPQGSATLFTQIQVPADGLGNQAFSVPQLSSLIGLPVYFQGALIAVGSSTLTNPTNLVLLP